jgi:hypothetical protein
MPYKTLLEIPGAFFVGLMVFIIVAALYQYQAVIIDNLTKLTENIGMKRICKIP